MSAQPGDLTPQIKLRIQNTYEQIELEIDPDLTYSIFRAFLAGLLVTKETDNQEQKRLIQLVRAGVKGMLLMYGSQILNALFGSTNHPLPAKGDDLIEWYADMFCKVGIAAATRNIIVMSASDEGVFDGSDSIQIIGFSSVASSTTEDSRLGIREKSGREQASALESCNECS